MTKLRSVLASATILAAIVPFAAQAQPITGLYIGGGMGYSLLTDETGSVDKLPGRSSPPLSLSQAIKLGFDGGIGLVGAVGYGVGNGVRLEVEADYRSNSQNNTGSNSTSSSSSSSGGSTSSNSNGTETKYGVMLNALYDISVGKRWIFPYVGVGFGYQYTHWGKVGVTANDIDYGNQPTVVTPSGTIGALAYQAIIGASFPISYVPGLAVTVEYRYMGLAGNRSYNGTGSTQYISSQYTNNNTKVHVSQDSNHTLLVGFRYAFNPDGVADTLTPAAAAAYQTPAPVPAPAAQASRMYLIFFDFDSAALTPRARDIVAEAVRNSARIPHTRIEVSGNADWSGDPAYNLRLSQARAEAVATEMTRWGVPRSVMDIHAYGDSRPLVPTAAGVREPQNRRVEIVYR